MSQKNEVQYFLARAGEMNGPFSHADIEKLRQQAKLSQYSWIWSSADSSWSPTEAAPQQNPIEALSLFSKKDVAAFCVRNEFVLSGKIQHQNMLGAEFVCDEEINAHTALRENLKLKLMIVPNAKGVVAKTEELRLAGIRKDEGRWILTLRK